MTKKETMMRLKHSPSRYPERHAAGTAILIPATKYMSDAEISDVEALDMPIEITEWRGGKRTPPIVMAIMRAEKTQPVGTPPGGFCERRVGTHIKTN
jgi:hypothetical protein